MNTLSLSLFGRFQASWNGNPIPGFRTRKVQALLIYLVAEPTAHNRESLMELLWPGMPERSARQNLRQILYNLQQEIPELTTKENESGITGENATAVLLHTNRQTIQLNPLADVAADVRQFTDLLHKVQVHAHVDLFTCHFCRQQLEEAVTLYVGDFLTDFYLDDSNEFEAWAESKRHTYRRHVLDALETLTTIATRQKAFPQARAYAERQLELDDLRESAYRQLMEILAMDGRRAEARALYERCQRLLVDELGMAPTSRTTDLYHKIMAGDVRFDAPQAQGARGYELKEEIGEGAYGTIYRAVQPTVGRDVAVKVIRRKYANDPQFIRRFEAEAQTIARLEHPYIVPLYDYWRDPEGAYLVMRLLRGGNLLAALQHGPWDTEMTAKMVEQVTSALATAHRQGIIHRDIKPANILFDEAGNAYLSDFGIAKDLTHEWQLTAEGGILGTPDYISPEQLRNEPVTPQSDLYSLGAVLYEVLAGERPFANTPFALRIQKHLQEPLPLLAASRPGLPHQLDDVIQQATAKRPSDRYPDALAMAEAFRHAIQGTVRSSDFSRVSPTPILEIYNPYKGLRAFQEADADDFYGRESLVQQLVSRLADGRFLAVVGPSGSGKSSLVKAGLIPALRQEAIPGSDQWFVAEMTPGTHPLEELELALLPIAVDPPPSLLEPLQKDERGLLRTLRRILPDQESSQLLLVIDQFEELFTQVTDEGQRRHFLNSLLAALHGPHSPLRVVVTLRADFYDRPLQIQTLADLFKQHTEIVLPMNQDELTWAIREPAQRMGVGIEEGVLAAMMADVADQPGALPLLQYALTELFEERQNNMMTLVAYRALGGVSGALAERAEEVYGGFDTAGQEAIRQLFLRLVTLGEGASDTFVSPDTRRRVCLGELEEVSVIGNRLSVNGSPITDNRSPITEFGRYRLLTFDHDPLTREPTVEVAHEALLREWPRLRGWLNESRDDVRLQRRLAVSTAEWQSANQDSSYLLRGAQLDQFAGWVGSSTVALTQLEKTYLDTSLADRDARRAAEEGRRQRELETVRQLAEEQTRRAEEQSRAARSLRRLAVGLAVVFLLATAAAVFAWQQQQTAVAESHVRATAEANALQSQATSAANAALASTREVEALTSEEKAVSAAATAAAAALEAQTQAGIAEAERAIAEEQTRLTRSRELALAALNNLDNDPELSILLALEALRVTHTREAEEALHQAVTTSRVRQTFGEGYGYSTVRYSQDGSRLAAGGRDPESDTGMVFVWDVATGAELLKLTDLGLGVNDVAFTPDGRQLLVAIEDVTSEQSLTIWDIDGRSLVDTFRSLPPDLVSQEGEGPIVNPQVLGLDVSPDGSRLVTGDYRPDTEELSASIWDMETGERLVSLPGYGFYDSWITGPIFSGDGRLVAGESPGQMATVWEADTGSVVVTITHALATDALTNGDLVNIAINSDGTRLATTGYGGHVRIWEIPTGRLLLDLAAGERVAENVAFSRDDSLLAASGESGQIYVWDAATGVEVARLTGHKSAGVVPAFAPDGRSLVSGAPDLSLRLWDLTFAHEEAIFDHPGGVFHATYNADGTLVATGGIDGSLIVWDAATQMPLHTFGNHTDLVDRVAFSPDSTRLASASDDGTAKLWDIASGEELLHLVTYEHWVNRVAYHPQGTQIAVGGNNGEVTVLDAESGETLFETTREASILSLAYDPTGRWLAVGTGRISDEENSLIILDTTTWETLPTMDFTSFANALAFSPDGQRLAIGAGRNLVVWDMMANETLLDFQPHNSRLQAVAWSPDGTFIVTASADGTNKVWDADTGELLLTLDHGRPGVVALHPDGTRLLVTSQEPDTPAHVYVLDMEALIELSQSRITRTYSPEECARYHIEPCPQGRNEWR